MLFYKGHVIDCMFGYVSIQRYNKMFTSIEDAKKFIDAQIAQEDVPYYKALIDYYGNENEPMGDLSRIMLACEYLEDYDINIEVYFDMYDKHIYREINGAIDNEMKVDPDGIRALKNYDLTKAW